MKKICAGLILLFITLICYGQSADTQETESYFSVNIKPGVGIPLINTGEILNTGLVSELEGSYKLFPFLDINLGLNHNLFPLKGDNRDIFLNLFSAGAGVWVGIEPIDNLNIGAKARGGYFFGFVNDEYTSLANNPYAQIGVGVTYDFIPVLRVGLEGGYRYFFGLHDDIVISLGLSYNFREWVPQGRQFQKGYLLQIEQVDFSIFPVLFKYYDNNPVGTAVLKNTSDKKVKNLRLTLFVKQYMDDPKECSVVKEVAPGQEVPVDLYALFNSKVLEITEGTKTSCNIKAEYKANGVEYEQEIITTMSLYNRNAITWDDDRKAAAFVTAKDPTILKFSKNISGMIKNLYGNALNKNMMQAMALYEALRLYGMSYVTDPTTPYRELSRDKLAVDFLQFPNQSLQFKAGDCDDLCILYCALLESVGIKTAFITFPGHIFMAFSLEMSDRKVKRHFLDMDKFIFVEDKAWLPVEVTALNTDFLTSWQLAAKKWWEYNLKKQTAFLPMHSAWEIYQPVGFQAQPESIALPAEEKLVERFLTGMKKFATREINPRVQELEEKIKQSQGDPRYENLLGVLYARYGLYEQAEKQFKSTVKTNKYMPALVNLGNINYLKQEMEQALSYYKQALAIEPKKTVIILSLARTYYAIEQYDKAREYYEKLKSLDPGMASEYGYLDTAGGD